MERYQPKDIFEGKDMKDLMLDMALIGQAVLGIRAFIEPQKYGDNPFVQTSIETAKAMGYITSDGVQAPLDVLELAYPSRDNNGYQ